MEKCAETKKQYEELLDYKRDFNLLIKNIRDKTTREQLKTKRKTIESMKQKLEKEFFPEKAVFVEQYRKQVAMMERLGILKWGERAITGIDGEKYSLPDEAGFIRILWKEKKMILRKREHGLGRIMLVPFGMPLETLIGIYGEALKAHFRAKKLFYPKENPEDADELIPSEKFDENEPVWTSSDWLDGSKPVGQRGKDISGEIVYYAQKFEKGDNGGGLTKREILEKQKEQKSATAGWRILMVETEDVIPRKGKGETKGGRKQIEAGKSVNEYMEILKSPEYAHEQGMALEDWLMHAIVTLEEKNQVLDDLGGNGCFCRLPGSFNFSSGWLADAFWARASRRARLGNDVPMVENALGGFRPAVEINNIGF